MVGEPFENNISEVFHDADGDSLIITADSSDSAVAEVDVDGASMFITPTGIGSTEIRITADDGNGESAETSFRINNYLAIYELRGEVMSSFIELYWDEYGEEGLKYHIYMNDELIDSTDTNHVSLTGLKPDTLNQECTL